MNTSRRALGPPVEIPRTTISIGPPSRSGVITSGSFFFTDEENRVGANEGSDFTGESFGFSMIPVSYTHLTLPTKA